MRFVLSSALLLAPLVGCVLLVPSYEPGEHCGFLGESACATCMRTSCQTEIDACCGVSSCHEDAFLSTTTGTTLGAVDTCANGNASSCANELEAATKTPQGEKVRVCIESTCKAQCAPNAIATKWSCDAPRTETAPCAACLYSKCSTQITECCGSSSCAKFYGIEEDLSICISGDEAGCAYRLKESAESGVAGVLRKCVREDCGTKCKGDGSFHRRCLLQNGGTYCSCTDAETMSGDECSKTKIGGGRCYVTKGGCVCGHFACTMKSGSYPSCTCSLDHDVEGGDESEACNFDILPKKPTSPDPMCCLSRSASTISCTCDTLTASCLTGAEPVTSCDRAYLLETKLKSSGTSDCAK